jgi:ATP/maltotriose-dependent transcriptional regulator MalT
MKKCQELGLFRSLADLLPIYQPIFELCLKSSDSSIRHYAKLLLEQGEMRIEATAQDPDQPIADPLSDRELEVIRLLAAGLSNTVIAERLFVSPGTVKRHLHNIFDKLGAISRLDAVTQARKRGLLP